MHCNFGNFSEKIATFYELCINVRGIFGTFDTDFFLLNLKIFGILYIDKF